MSEDKKGTNKKQKRSDYNVSKLSGKNTASTINDQQLVGIKGLKKEDFNKNLYTKENSLFNEKDEKK